MVHFQYKRSSPHYSIPIPFFRGTQAHSLVSAPLFRTNSDPYSVIFVTRDSPHIVNNFPPIHFLLLKTLFIFVLTI